MNIKTQTLAIAVCIAIASIQFVSCKKDAAKTDVAKSVSLTQNISGPITDSILNRGLVAWYTFDSSIADKSGNHNKIVFNSAVAVAGKNGIPKTAYKFDGVSSYMQVNNSSSLNPFKISLYALVKPKGFYAGPCHYNYILCKETQDPDLGRYVLGFGDQKYYNFNGCSSPVAPNYENLFAAYGDGTTSDAGGFDTTQYVKLNQWYSLVYTFDGVTSKFYVNNILVDSTVQQATTFTATTTPLYIGKTPNPSYPYYFNGLIDEIRIYKRALGYKEVQELYNRRFNQQ